MTWIKVIYKAGGNWTALTAFPISGFTREQWEEIKAEVEGDLRDERLEDIGSWVNIDTRTS